MTRFSHTRILRYVEKKKLNPTEVTDIIVYEG